jgi:hypothetical protein
MDAYAVKKILPRIFIAALGINLSYYIMIIAIDIVNVIGDGIADLIVLPFTNATPPLENWDPGELSKIIMSVLIAFVAIKGISGVFRRKKGQSITSAGLSTAKNGLSWFMLTIALPIGLIVLAIFVVLTIRLGLIIGLAISAPVAIACFVLPNTEGIFKKWWSLFMTTLMIYPIVMGLIALGRVATYIFGNIDGQTVAGLTGVFAVLAQFIPLALIPFSFKIAGGAIGALGKLVDGSRGGIKSFVQGSSEDPHSRINKANLRRDSAKLEREESGIHRANAFASSRKGKLGRSAGKFMSRRMGNLSDIEQRRSALNKRMQEVSSFTGTGPDSTLRGLSVDKKSALQTGEGNQWQWSAYKKDAAGNYELDKNGKKVADDGAKRQFKTLGGAWVDEAAVDAAHKEHGWNQAMVQRSLSYELSKASSDEEISNVDNNYARVAQGLGLDQRQAGDVWTGSGYESQNRSLQHKHMKVKDDGAGGYQLQFEGEQQANFVKDFYENRAAYAGSNMNASAISRLRESQTEAVDTVESLDQIKDGGGIFSDEQQARYDSAHTVLSQTEAISDTFQTELRGGATIPGEDGAGTGETVTTASGPAHSADEVAALNTQVNDWRGRQDLRGKRPSPLQGPTNPQAPKRSVEKQTSGAKDDTNTAGRLF